MFDTDVIVVGAGPVGLCLAEFLARRGVEVTILERGSTVSEEWRASTFHAATLELLDQLELGEALVAEGNVARIEQHRAPDVGVIAEFDYGVLADICPFPFRLQCPQQRLVALLDEQLRRRDNVTMRFGAIYTTSDRDADGVTAHVEQADGGAFSLRARLLVGADGGSSAVRRSLDIAFEGVTYEDRFLQLSTPYDVREVLPDVRTANYVYDPDDHMQLLHLPDAWKVTIPIGADEREEDATQYRASAQRLARILGTDADLPLEGIKIYTVHQRVAERFHEGGRVALCGDAAHVNSPVGGMGLNSGIHDAFDLGATIERILDQGATDDAGRRELGAYAERRRRVAVDFVRRITHRNTEDLGERDPQRRLEIFEELRRTAADPGRVRERVYASSMLASLAQNAA